MSHAVPATAYTNAILGLLNTPAVIYMTGTGPSPSGSNLPNAPTLGKYGFFNAHTPVLPGVAVSSFLSAVPAIFGGRRCAMVAVSNIIRWQTDTQVDGDLIWPYGNQTAPT